MIEDRWADFLTQAVLGDAASVLFFRIRDYSYHLTDRTATISLVLSESCHLPIQAPLGPGQLVLWEIDEGGRRLRRVSRILSVGEGLIRVGNTAWLRGDMRWPDDCTGDRLCRPMQYLSPPAAPSHREA